MNTGIHNFGSSWSDTLSFSRNPQVSDEHREMTRQALEMVMEALKNHDIPALEKAKERSVWCKQCGHQLTLATAGVQKEEECFQLLCSRCRALILQVRSRSAVALGFLSKIFSELNEETNHFEGHAEEINHCLWAFQQHDYQRCIDLALPLIQLSTHPQLVQVLVISAQRLGQTELVEQTGELALGPTTRHSPWEATLLKLTLGMLGPEEAMKSARSDIDRCRVLFYYAARLITLTQKRKAKEIFHQVQRFEINFIEQTMVASELDLT